MADETEEVSPWEAQAKSTEGVKESLTEIEKLAKAVLERHTDTVAELASQVEFLKQSKDIAASTVGLIENNLALRNKETELANALLLGLERELTLKGEINDEDRKRLEDLRSAVKAISDQEKASKSLNVATDRLVKTTLGVSNAWEDTVLGSITKAEGGIKQFGKGLRAALNPADIAGSTMMKVQESTLALMFAQDKLGAQFMKTTGLGRDYVSTINQAYLANRKFAVSLEQNTQAATALVTQMAQFTMMTDTERQELTGLTSLMDQAGVSAASTAEAFNLLTKGMKMNVPQLKKTSEELFGLAKSLSIPPDIIFKDFNAASAELAKYGPQMIGVFSDLEKQAKNTGLSVQTLLGLAKQFDTFEGAGTAVGRLNALLGGPYLNSIDMLNMSEAERVKTLRESISLSGKSWSSMHRFERQAIASAAGISDMTVAAKLFGGTNADFQAYNATQKDIEEQAKRNADITKKWSELMMSFGVSLLPVVQGLHGFVDGILSIANALGPLTPILLYFFGAMTLMHKAVVATTAAKKSLATIQTFLAARTAAATATTEVATAATYSMTAATEVATASTTRLNTSLLGTRVALFGVLGILAGAYMIFGKTSRVVKVLGAALIGLTAAMIAYKIAKSGIAAPIAAGLIAGGLAAIPAMMRSVPKRRRGVDETTDSLFIAGDGPGTRDNRELVATGNQKSSVITNENTEALLGAGGKGGAIGALTTQVAALTAAMQSSTNKPSSSPNTKTYLQVDQGILAELVMDVVDKNVGVTT